MDPCPLVLITPEQHYLNDPMTADHPSLAASPGSGNSARIRALGPQPISTSWGYWDGYLAWVPISIHAYLGKGLRPALRGPTYYGHGEGPLGPCTCRRHVPWPAWPSMCPFVPGEP